MDLEGRTVVVTGAAGGIGRAIAMRSLGAGARVVAGDIDAAGLDALARAGAICQVADVSDPEAAANLIRRAHDESGRVDVLFNNAGYGQARRIEDVGPDEFERLVRVHVFGTVYGMRAAIPIMRGQNHGRIVNTLSRAAELCRAGSGAYSAAKAALWAVTRVAAEETRDANVLVNGLIPGPTNTAIWGRDMPQLQPPEAVWPTARMLATLPRGGPTGQVFWNEKPYALMDPANPRAAQV
jgi:NAD(P)-dependent dehydrogenase (short-subunit alcohol dehydrogenase family)